MIEYHKIRRVVLEISSRCNASCPDCPRNFFGVDVLDNYPRCDLSLEQCKTIFQPDFLRQLRWLEISGNHGDFVTARHGVEIVEYFFTTNPNLMVHISTNASARPDMWARLGRTPAQVQFRLDGLADTHALYRAGTDWPSIIENARSFIETGGYAIWHMIAFDHNRHQIDQCRDLSVDLGFQEFRLTDLPRGQRNRLPVFTSDRRLSHVIGGYDNSTDFEHLLHHYKARDHWQDSEYSQPAQHIACDAVGDGENQGIYVASNGEVYPCCFLGFYPLINDRRLSNLQIRPMIQKNNALHHDIATAIDWFSQIKQSWQQPTVAQGRVDACNSTCGQCNRS